jgi:tryptophan-rich sensory protein
MSRLVRLGVSLLLCFGAGLLGSIFVSDQVGVWYDALQKPFFMPPN